MCTAIIEMPTVMSNWTPDEGSINPREQTIPDPELEEIALERLIKRKNYWGFLEGWDALLYLRSMSAPATEEKSIDISSLWSKLSSLLPRDPQLERRARKLAWQILKGSHVTCEWDNIFLSELTQKEIRMSDEEFMALYPDQMKTARKKGGRPRKYRTVRAQKEGHAERQRRYRARKRLVVGDVMKTPSQLAEN